MNSFDVADLKENTFFTADVVLDNTFLLLQSSTPVTQSLIDALKDWEFKKVYSTGNLVSNMSMRGTDGGMMIRMQLKKILNYTRVSSLEYFLTWIAPKRNDGSRDFTILPASTTLCPANSNAQKKLQQFLDDTRELFNKQNKGDIKEFYTDSVSVTP